MLIPNNKKYRDDFVAISNFIFDYKGEIKYDDLITFVISYEYYKCFYQNYHIFKDLISYHNSHLNDKKFEPVYENDKSLDDLLGL